jgi:REP element-mobilizing transposase RayT
VPGNIYFVTCCTSPRKGNLTEASFAHALIETIKASDGNCETRTYAFTVMSDHCRWLFRLGPRLSLGRVIAKFKFHTRLALQQRDLVWQRDYHEHCLRPDEEPEDYALYIFLNPYRAGLLAAGASWPWWWTGGPQSLRFIDLLDDTGSPPREWAGLPIPTSTKHGE